MSPARRIACVLLPFAAGYYLSYLFRSINALIAGDLTAELGLSAADLGLLTSVYFLLFAAAQLPFGVLLDRHGPRTIQSVLLLIAGAGALVFALAEGLIGLILGRALIGLGVALALMSGFKAIVLWFPVERVALANGWLVMLGALGAVTATGPADLAVTTLGWRGLFALLGALSALAALLVMLAVPNTNTKPTTQSSRQAVSLSTIYCDPRFWRLAPLSTVGIGMSWSLQGLWAAPWLKDVAGCDRATVVQFLCLMAIALCASALLLGVVADRLRRAGVRTEAVLALTLVLSMAAQLALVLGLPLPSCLLWCVIGAAGAATVLSYASLASYFPREASGRANAALNLLHMGGTFVLQSATGFVIEQWPQADGRYPVEAHQAALAAGLALQLAALLWFAMPRRRPLLSMQRAVVLLAPATQIRLVTASPPLAVAMTGRSAQLALAQRRIAHWRRAAAASVSLCMALTVALVAVVSPRERALSLYVQAAHGGRRGRRSHSRLSLWHRAPYRTSWCAAGSFLNRDLGPVMSNPQKERIGFIVHLCKAGRNHKKRSQCRSEWLRFAHARSSGSIAATSGNGPNWSRRMKHAQGLRRFTQESPPDQLRDQVEYGGLRIKTNATVDSSLVIDVGIADSVDAASWTCTLRHRHWTQGRIFAYQAANVCARDPHPRGPDRSTETPFAAQKRATWRAIMVLADAYPRWEGTAPPAALVGFAGQRTIG